MGTVLRFLVIGPPGIRHPRPDSPCIGEAALVQDERIRLRGNDRSRIPVRHCDINQEVTLAEGAAAFAVLVVVQFTITFISVRSDRFERLLEAEPTLLYRNGMMLTESLRRVRVTEREVETIARRRGLPSQDTLSAVILEADGSFSVIESSDEIDLYSDDQADS